MVRKIANKAEARAIKDHTCVQMGAVAVLTTCNRCGSTVVGIVLADCPELCAIECKNCGNSEEIAIGD
jgi:hypothetical protein